MSLKGSNGLYVTAEYGGGIDPRRSSLIALYCNRQEIGGYEKFDLISNSDGSISLKTFNGNYITAEGGGGSYLRTDAAEIGAWEKFYLYEGNSFLCSDKTHFLTVEVLWDQRIVANRTQRGSWEVFEIIGNKWRPTLAEIKNFKGNFGTMRLDYLDGYGVKEPYNKVLWTPAYGIYSKGVRSKIRKDYRNKGLTHFVIQLRGNIYNDYFPALDESQQNVWLEELYSDKLIPVVNIYADDDDDIYLNDAVLRNIVCAFTKWDGADGFDDEPQSGVIVGRNKDHILQVRNNYPDINLYFHYLANYGSPCGSTANPPISTHGADWWKFAESSGVIGYLLQTYFEGEYQDIINNTLAFNASMQVRFNGFHGWPTGLDLILFENVEYHVKNNPDFWTEDRCNSFNEILLNEPLPVEGGYTGVPFSGYCSGRVDVS